MIAQPSGQRAGIDLADAGDAIALKVPVQRLIRPPIRNYRTHFADDKGSHLWSITFDIFTVDPGIANMGHRHTDHLAAIGGIGKDFLIAGQASVEDNFTHNGGGCTKGFASVDCAIL